MRRTAAIVVAALMVTSVLAPVAMGSAAAEDGEAYVGSHVEFEVDSNAVVDYAVGGDVVFDEIRVESESATDAGLGAGADADLTADIDGAELGMSATAEGQATVGSEGGSEIRAHDNERAQLVVDAGDEDTGVAVEVNAGAEASEADGHVTVESDGETGTFLVIGDGEVRVDSEGDVVAELDDDAELVYRHNGAERDEEDEKQEDLIADGEAAAEFFVIDDGDGQVAESVEYAGDITVAAESTAESELEITVERTTDQGTVVITEVSESVIESTEDLQVSVDGEASTAVDSHQELRSTADGDGETAYTVTSAANADASAAVLVAIDGFSERTVTMEDGVEDDGDAEDDGDVDDGTPESEDGDAGADDGDTDDETPESDGGDADADDGDSDTDAGDVDEEVPGFGVVTALVAMLSVIGFLRR